MSILLRAPWRRSWFAAAFLAILAMVSCRPKPPPPVVDPPPPSAADAEPVRLLVIDDQPLAEVLQRHWKARADSGLAVVVRPQAEVLAADRLDADAVVFPSALLGQLAERRQIVPLSQPLLNDPRLQLRDVFELQRLRETHWGTRAWAVTFGSPQLVLIYRRDMFERLGVPPPTTWQEYQQLVERLGQRSELGDLAPPPESNWTPAIEPLAPGWAGQLLLARAATYARNPSQFSTLFDFSTMDPLIDQPPFVRALEELVATAKVTGGAGMTQTPTTAREALATGKTAMVLAWPTATDRTESAGKWPWGFAELPGSRDVYHMDIGRWERRAEGDDGRVPLLAIAGRLGAVTREARRQAAAENVLAWLAGKEWSAEIAPASDATTLFRAGHAASAARWIEPSRTAEEAKAYFELAQQSQNRGLHLFSPRIPGRDAYLAALDTAVHAAIAGDQAPAEALQTAAVAWRAITDKLGKEQQRLAYARCLGLEE